MHRSSYRPSQERRHIGISAYFLLAGPFVTMGLGSVILVLAGLASPSGPDGHITIASLGLYCLIGAIAGLVPRRRVRAVLALLAHAGLFVGGIVDGTNLGLPLCVILALPFGVGWFRLVDDPARETRVDSCLGTQPGDGRYYR